ncbi:filamentous hemagglutinin N-terminal domain-containing protein [Nitratireductor aquibiodomus]|uniref:two-partner secretion domain-containing protein n=1 Tax=Nitratireductor aquibiodomus TaxID=204799 RepID=UPI0019D39460|nr:MBG domain-containing protein [Nitratireductor aquibiodomus]MBN7760757.1 filamentous hemagglutinin N-terminal domain-containing protein [Nitratireductor aquibiodomus]
MTDRMVGFCATETGRGSRTLSKRVRLSRALYASLMLTTALVPATAMADDVLPTGGQFTTGNGTISANGPRLDIRQTTETGVVNWSGFSVGSGNQVHFDNGNGATLNRVTGNVSSQIDGSLTATGSVFLINPAGVVVGSGGLVATGGSFVASTHDVTDSDFLNGGGMTFSGNGTAEVTNAGTIRSAQGDIALIARRVENTGTLEAPNGTAALGAGYKVLMKDAADTDGLLSVELGGPDTEAVNSGTIAAANAEIRANGGNVYALAGNTDDVIKATGVTSSGGRIFLTAGATGKVRASGRLKARRMAANVPIPTPRPAREGGTITVTGGDITVTGTFDASAESDGDRGGEIMIFAEKDTTVSGALSARGGTGGTGGFIETSGRKTVDFNGVSIDTSAAGGTTGNWLIDPEDIIITYGPAQTIQNALANSNVTLQTTATTANGPVAGTPGAGDIIVNNGLAWSSTNTLTLDAYNDIEMNAGVLAPNGGLTLIAKGQGGPDSVGTIHTHSNYALVDVGTFTLQRGYWGQVGAALPSFKAGDFRVDEYAGQFVRARGGDGTAANPYQLSDIYGLQGITDRDRRAGVFAQLSYQLVSDIDASPVSGWNSGAGFRPVRLAGNLDGQGHTIDGLFINRPSGHNVALISYWGGAVPSEPEIKDLNVTNASVTGGSQTAILVGENSGGAIGHHMSNVTVSGTVETETWGAGVVGRFHGNLDRSTMTNVHADVSVTENGTGSAVGGLVSIVTEGLTISNSSSTGTITGSRSGGLVGTANDNSNRVENSYSTATVVASGNFRVAGGLVGGSEDLTIENSYFAGQVLGINGASAGGLIGEADRYTTIMNSFVTGRVATDGYAGALIGTLRNNNVSVTNAAWDIGTTGQSDAIGYTAFYTPTVTNTGSRTTAQMQGSLDFGLGFSLNNTIWATGNDLYPYFGWQYASTPVAVSGTAYADSGSTPLSGADVSGISGGSLFGSAVTGANGYYYILTDAGSLDAAGVLTYLDGESTQSATYSDRMTASGVSGADIWGNTFRVETDAAALTDVSTNLQTTLGSFSDSDLDFITNLPGSVLRSDNNGKSLDIVLDAGSDFSLNMSMHAGGGLTASTGGTFSVDKSSVFVGAVNGDLTVNGDLAWASSNELTLYSHASNTSITVNGSVTAASGRLRVDRTGTATNVAAMVTGDIYVDRFQSDASWTQVGSTLPGFHANDFNIAGGEFLRALGGDGSSATPYQIADVYGLQGVGSSGLLGSAFVLANDIDASGTAGWNGGAGFDPIGVYGAEFSGSLDGQGHAISGLTIDRAADDYVGLFGYAAAGSSLSDLILSGGSITGNGHVGALAGYAGSTIGDVQTSTDVSGTAHSIGGLVGTLDGTVARSSATGAVTGIGGVSDIGGLVGVAYGGSTIHQSYATGNVTVGGAINLNFNFGGLVGYNTGSITQSFATGNVTAGGNGAGGLAGVNDGSITDSYATGAVSAAAFAGGLLGQLATSGSVARAYATGSASAGDGNEGGIAGLVDTGASFSATLWDTDASGLTDAVGFSYDPTVPGVTGLTGAQMTQLSTFTAYGFNIDDEGGTGAVWRIYDGYTTPLLRGFMTGLSVTGGSVSKVYDGSAASSDVGTLVYGGPYDGSRIFGTASYLAANADAGTYTGGNLTLAGLYSGQFGYDLTLESGSLAITPATLWVTANAASMTYGDGAPTLGYSHSGLVGGDNASVFTGALSSGATSTSDVGAYGITQGSLSAGGNYQIAFTGAGVTVNRRAVTVRADDLQRDIDEANPALTYAIVSGSLVNGDHMSGSLSTTANLNSPVGAYAIGQGSLALSPNYELTYLGGILTVLDGSNIPTPDIQPQAYESSPPLLIEAGDGETETCEPVAVSESGPLAVYPCNRSYGAWLSAAVE